ncbi:PRC-barrel domain-containing protein [Halomonas sp. 18H]|uniref:PRC-barrel domain-containing protein n=1 Tax=Halomonas almeriensis TaxID=308163 RepID=UPI002230362F|nr:MULTISPECIES: PRC-barrel domain-containing protein [Halomonas]MCW4149329.1 PRC-barrel domain-containing protein [Halomonas sp. 18H]MDN3553725.1 PRC-barrel domain-containing protein [Halomonas almeriensis]
MTLAKKIQHSTRFPLLGAGLVFTTALSANAMEAPQGLYSIDELLDADVYTRSDDHQSIGEVEDVLLNDEMRLHALVVDTGNLLDMGEKQYVIGVEDFTVETRNGDNLDTIAYRVHLNLEAEALSKQPEYTDTWWSEARQNLQQAWQDTKQGASSAWETTQSTANSLLDKAGGALESLGEQTQEAAGDAADATGEAADATGEAAESTQQSVEDASQ